MPQCKKYEIAYFIHEKHFNSLQQLFMSKKHCFMLFVFTFYMRSIRVIM